MAELFKYKTINDYTMYSLVNKYLYFSKPSELDDIFECKVCPNFDNTTDIEIQNWINLQIQNHAVDFNYNTVQEVRDAIVTGEFENRYINNKRIVEKYHVLSLCKEKDNQKLWSLYANTYNGICIGYNVIDNDDGNYNMLVKNPQSTYPTLQVPLTNFSINHLGTYATFRPTDYHNEGQYSYNWINEKFYETENNQTDIKYDGLNNNGDRQNIYRTILNSKSGEWKDQKEYRCFYNDYGKAGSKIYYPDETLSRIIFGFNVDEKKRKDIYELINNSYSSLVEFEIVKPDYKTRTIKFDPYQP